MFYGLIYAGLWLFNCLSPPTIHEVKNNKCGIPRLSVVPRVDSNGRASYVYLGVWQVQIVKRVHLVASCCTRGVAALIVCTFDLKSHWQEVPMIAGTWAFSQDRHSKSTSRRKVVPAQAVHKGWRDVVARDKLLECGRGYTQLIGIMGYGLIPTSDKKFIDEANSRPCVRQSLLMFLVQRNSQELKASALLDRFLRSHQLPNGIKFCLNAYHTSMSIPNRPPSNTSNW